jgi:hypothetical protein
VVELRQGRVAKDLIEASTMKRPALIALLLISLTVSLAFGSRADKSNTLTQCIAKADVIIIGFVRAKEDHGDSGVATVDVLRVLKGKVDAKQLKIVDPAFRSRIVISPEGPIPVKTDEGYIFFLQTRSPGVEEWKLFNHFDGVIYSCNPVVEEIVAQVK